MSEILYALRTGQKTDGKSAFEKQFGRERNTVKSNILTELVNKGKDVSEQESGFKFEKSDFEEEVDSLEKGYEEVSWSRSSKRKEAEFGTKATYLDVLAGREEEAD